MSLIYLAIVFAVMIVLLILKKPLYLAIGSGIISLILLYQFDMTKIGQASLSFITNKDSIAILVSMYLITYLQKVLESRKAIKLAEGDLTRLFQSRRVTIAGASLVIGLLPSAAAMILCADIVKHQTDGYLEPEEQAFRLLGSDIFQNQVYRPIRVSFSWQVFQESPCHNFFSICWYL